MKKLNIKNEMKVTRKNPFIKIASACLIVTSLFLNTAQAMPKAEAASSSRSYLQNGTYALKLHDNKNLCLNVQYKSTQADRANIVVDNWSNESNERWIVTNRGNNYYTLSPEHCPNLCLNVLLADRTPGKLLTLHGYAANDAASLWSFHAEGDGSYQLKNKATGLVADIKDGNYKIGNKAITWTANGYRRAQAYYPVLLSASNTSSTLNSNSVSSARTYMSNGTYAFLMRAKTSTCLNTIFASTAENKATIGLDKWNNEKNESWIVVNRGSNYVTIAPKHASNLHLTDASGRLTIKRYSSSDASILWSFHKNAQGGYVVKNKQTGRVIDLSNANFSIGNGFICYPLNASSAQIFTISKISSSTSGSTVSQPSSYVSIPSNANITTSSKEQARFNTLTSMMNGLSYNGAYKTGTYYRGEYYTEQCKGFAKSIWHKLYGISSIGSTKEKPNNHQVYYSSSKTRCLGSLASLNQTSVKSLFSSARAGDFVQMRRSHGGSHSAIVYQVSSSGVTFYEANVPGSNYIAKNFYSWAQLCDDNQKMSVYTAKNY